MRNTTQAPTDGATRQVVSAAASMRRSTDEACDPMAWLTGIGYEWYLRRLPDKLRGFHVPAGYIVVNDRLSQCEQRFTAAHEFAHALVSRGDLLLGGADEEWAADLFAAECLLPVTKVRSAGPAAAWPQVPADVAAWQLSRAGYARTVQTIAGRVVCRDCGWRSLSAACSCAAVRRRAA